MIFTLEALEAKKGDCLIVHYGSARSPKLVVIDGGPAGVYAGTLKPRLSQIVKKFRRSADRPLGIEMVMVSHIDDDHIHGIQDWFSDLDESDNGVPFTIQTLWFNSFDDVVGNGADELFSRLGRISSRNFASDAEQARHSAAIIASVPQGRRLRDTATRLAIQPNAGFRGLVMARKTGRTALTLAGGLKLTVLAPSRQRLEELNAEWEKSIKKQKKPKLTAAFVDRSVANLSSIVVLAEFSSGGKKRSMLLTGDARGDDILSAVKSAKLSKQGTLDVDLLKLPHHGSNRNLALEFFEKVRADHYVISANGEHENPDREVFEWISQARGDDTYTIYVTNEKLREPKKKINIEALVKKTLRATAKASPNRRVVFREPKALSLKVDLLSPLHF